MNIKYRTEIDGLRAIAVIPVVFYHAEFFLFKGGCLEEEFYDYMHFDIECTFKNLKYKN